MQIRTVRFDHPDAVKLNEQVQLEYAERYGEGDLTLLNPAEFDPPRGLYLIAYDEGFRDGDAEIKRMYVVREARGRGLARRILAALEDSACQAGRIRMVLETGTMQPEAIALYISSGYVPAQKFGLYRHHDNSRCFAKPLAAV